MINNQSNKFLSLKKYFLLALSIYLILYCFPFPLSYIPNSIETLEWLAQPIDWFSRWFGKSVLGIADLKNASEYMYGDSIFEFVKIISLPVLSLMLSLVIFAFSFRKHDYKKLFNWAIIYVRYNIGSNLFVMGCAMLLNSGHYDSLDIHALEKPIGDYYGSELFWATIGYSKGYIMFCGIGQVIIGSLLFFRKTTVLGAFLAIGFYLNLLAYNFAFGFASKVYLTHVILFLLIVLGPDIKGLFRFFILGKSGELKSQGVSSTTSELRVMRIIAKYSFLALLLVHELTRLANNKNVIYPLSGSYENIEFIKNGDTLNVGEWPTKWNKLIIDKGFASIVKNSEDYIPKIKINVDTANHKFDLMTYTDTTKKSTFDYIEQIKFGYRFLTISGVYVNDTIQARFRKKSKEEFNLIYYKAPNINY